MRKGRRSIRLSEYDYSKPSVYYVTLCVQNFKCILAQVIGNQIQLKESGEICLEVWRSLPILFPSLSLDVVTIMPNHIHGILLLNLDDENPDNQPSLGDVIGTYQSLVFQQYHLWIKENGLNLKAKFWQRNYYEHIIRDENDWERIRKYIIENPMNWNDDTYYQNQ